MKIDTDFLVNMQAGMQWGSRRQWGNSEGSGVAERKQWGNREGSGVTMKEVGNRESSEVTERRQ